jgi:hypothetical protein
MPQTIYTATDAAGAVHKRSTKCRTYTHMVVYLPSYEFDLSQAAKQYAYDGDNWEFHCQMVTWGGIFEGRRESWHTDEKIAADLALSTERAGEFASRAEAMAGQAQKRVAFVMERQANGYFAAWQSLGWCGRHDLAVKLASQATGPRFAKVAILPVTASR